ncbi:MAG: hypothetical protein IJU02_07055 [Lachnospiraceae bacterium]|nr:hypothetical protein [Lachnospiraceae bacterium]
MSVCINTSTREFKETAQRLNIHPDNLELVLHKFINDPSRSREVPSDLEIIKELWGTPFIASEEQIKLYKEAEHYQQMTFSTIEDMNKQVEELLKYYPKSAISTFQNIRGQYVIDVGVPFSSENDGITLKHKFELEKETMEDISRMIKRDWNLSNETLVQVMQAIDAYRAEKLSDEVKDVQPTQYFDKSNMTTVGDILVKLSKLSTEKDIREIAKLLLKNGGRGSKVPIVRTNKRWGLRGQYRIDGKIIINQRAMSGTTDAEALNSYERTILHEIAHALTVDAYNTNDELRNEANQLFSEFKEIQSKYKLPVMYGGKNAKEFIAEFMGRKTFREVLMYMEPTNGNVSLGRKILNYIKKVLGITPKSKLYDRAEEMILKLLDANNRLEETSAKKDQALNDGRDDSFMDNIRNRINELRKYLENAYRVQHDLEHIKQESMHLPHARILGKLRAEARRRNKANGTRVTVEDNLTILRNDHEQQRELDNLQDPNYVNNLRATEEEKKVQEWKKQLLIDAVQHEKELLNPYGLTGNEYEGLEASLNDEGEQRLVDQLIEHLNDIEGIEVNTSDEFAKQYLQYKDILPEIRKEMEDIKQKAIADGTFMKAPNGQPTNLTERQWLQVRTKAFKEWFGDWERIAPKAAKELLIKDGEINWDYFENVLNTYHNSQPEEMFSKGRYTLATREEKHFTGEKNTLNHIKFVTQSMLKLLEGEFDIDLPFVPEARASLKNQKDLMILAAMFHDVAKPYRHGDIHGWESADILRDILGIDYNNRLAEWAVRHHMAMPFSHKAEFNLSNPEAIEVAKNIARDAKRLGIDAQTAINAFVLINAADVINGRELSVEDNWAKKAKDNGSNRYGEDISVKNVLTIELNEKVELLKKAFRDIQNEDLGNSRYNYENQIRFDYMSFPEGGREDGKLPYLSNNTTDAAYNNVSKVVDENGEPLVVYRASSLHNTGNSTPYTIFDPSKNNSGFFFTNERAANERYGGVNVRAFFLNLRNPDVSNNFNILQADREVSTSMGYDGVLFSPNEGGVYGEDFEVKVFGPNQIKSATDNVGSFSTENDDIQSFETSNGEVYGFATPEGKMYLDKSKVNAEHPIHEYTHLWDTAVQQRNPELWESGIALMQSLPIWDEIVNSEQYGKKWEAKGITGQKFINLVASEVHARLVGTEGAELMRNIAKKKGYANIIDKVKQWLLDFWKELRSTFGNWSREDLDTLTLKEFNAMTVRDFVNKTPLRLNAQTSETQFAISQQKYQVLTDAVKVEYTSNFWTREQVEQDTGRVYLFGDNTEDRLTGYIPTSTQAVIRGLPNAIGIDTKKNRGTSESSYFTNADLPLFITQVEEALMKAINSGKIIVIPSDGIGTGKAQLAQRAPELYNYLQRRLAQLANDRTKVSQNYSTPEEFLTEENYVQLTNRENVGIKLGRSGISDGKPTALVANDVTVDEFFNYIEGKVQSNTSQQKKKVFEELEKLGYTKERLQKLITTPEDAQKFIAYHELSHLYNKDINIYWRTNEKGKDKHKDMMLPEKIAIEVNATIDAWTRLEREKKESSERTMDIRYGSGENADLSNAAIRPFKIQLYGEEVDRFWKAFNDAYFESDFGVSIEKRKGGYEDTVSDDAVDQSQEFNYSGKWFTIEANEESLIFASVAQAIQYFKSLLLPAEKVSEDNFVRDLFTMVSEKAYMETDANKLRELDNKYSLTSQGLKAWNDHKREIVKFLIKESFRQNRKELARLLYTGNTPFTSNHEIEEWKELFPELLNEVRNELREEERNKFQDYAPIPFEDYDYIELANQNTMTISTTEIPAATLPTPNSPVVQQEEVVNIQGEELSKEEIEQNNKMVREHIMEQSKLTTQINNLLDDNIFTATEVRDIAEQAVFWISDYITEIQANPEKAISEYGETGLKDKDVSTMSRVEIAKAIGAKELLNRCKEVFSSENNEFDDFDLIDKSIKITDNWGAIMVIAQPTFLELEDFSLMYNDDGILEVNTDLNMDADNFNTSNDESTINETEGNLQEHWQIESRTLDVIKSMNQITKQALRQCYITDNEGNIETSEFGVKRRLTIREATNSILRWTQGALSLDAMVLKLQEKQESNPWIKQLIERLTDKSGNETILQSSFYTAFCKHFQTYSVVKKDGNTYQSVTVNENPALLDIMKGITTQYNIGEHPLFTAAGINKQGLTEIQREFKTVREFSENPDFNNKNKVEEVSTSIGYIASILGYYVTPDIVQRYLNEETLKDIRSALGYIITTLDRNKDNKEYNPFAFRGGIRGNIREFLKPLSQHLEDISIPSFYDSGKMYQSYVTPSYTTKLLQKFKLTGKEFDNFIQEEFAQYEWFHMGNSIETGWRNNMLKALVTDANARKIFAHKVQLNFNKKNYMRTMTDAEYTLSLIAEYYAEDNSSDKSVVPAWFRMPMLSNKPSAEYIRFYSYRGSNYKETILDNLIDLFGQELSRMQTVIRRNFSNADPRYINNFDKNGRKFCFLTSLNEHLENKNSEVGKLIREKLQGKGIDDTRLNELVREELRKTMEARVQSILSTWEKDGIVKNARHIKSIAGTDAEVKAALENFIWNDFLAANNIIQMFVTDIAFYKDAEDLQKRLAQIHAPGIRGRVDAVDFNGQAVSNGIERTIYLKDFDNFISNIIDNVSEVFDRRIATAKSDTERNGLMVLKDSLVRPRTYNEDGTVKDAGGAFYNINVADAQAYNCPTSYRKKAFIFGKWSKQAEKIYEKIRKGEYSDLVYSDLKIAFQPLKPFLYTQMEKEAGVADVPMPKLKCPVQNKNSEYLLVLADAILQGEHTSRPNILRAIFEVMEKSHYDENGNYKTNGIDTVQFESAVKSTLTGAIDLNQFLEDSNGESLAEEHLTACIYDGQSNSYNRTFVHELNFEDYCLQQEVPEHFKDHFQVHGSQGRYILPSELEEVDAYGNEVTYEIEGRKLNAKDFKREYEDTISQNIEESLLELTELLHLDSTSTAERNVALSKILQREILSSPRYGIDLYLACSVDENGEFRIPKGDPIQSKRIEQLINSVIKNRVNKQEIAGGPVVQVSNFGMSRQLNIKFKDKVNGGLLMTRSEWEVSESKKETSYEEYVKNNQGGIAYFEVFAPIYTNDLFEQFADDQGNIDINKIELINPDLLKLIGYRIPTEAKYSMAPMKIVGFLPREAGDGIMMPYDITLLTGSDFDVDKMYLMRKEITLAHRFNLKKGENMTAAELDYFKHNKSRIEEYLKNAINLKGKATREETQVIEQEVKAKIDLEKKTENRIHQENIDKIESRFELVDEEIETKRGKKKHQRLSDADYRKEIRKENRRHRMRIDQIEAKESDYLLQEIERFEEKKVKNKIDQFLNTFNKRPSILDDVLDRELRKAYLAYNYKDMSPTFGRTYRNNKIFDMSYEVLTHETTAHEILNPGGFEPQKKVGYMVAAYKDPSNNYSWEQLEKMSTKELKNLAIKGKNLLYIDTQIQFYKQNSAAGSLVSVFAVNRTAHAVVENDGYRIDVLKACNTARPFTIAGMKFGSTMEIDVRYNLNGESVGKVLGSLVASAVDAVKDPVLNLMNINGETANILNTLVRFGMPFEDAAIFLSTSTISNLLREYYSRNISGKRSLYQIVKDRIAKMEKDHGFDKDSPIHDEPLTKKELIGAIRKASIETEYKILNTFNKLQLLANPVRAITFATRFNSMASAVGPLIVDNLMLEYQMMGFVSNSNLINKYGEEVTIMDILQEHPILSMFYNTLGIAQRVFGNMPANSGGFRNILNSIFDTNLGRTLISDKKLLSSLSDFYQSYLLVKNGVIDENRLETVINNFPRELIKQNIKEKYRDNYLIQSIKYDTDKAGRPTINVDITGVDTTVRQKLESAWLDLHNVDPKLSYKLFEYCFFRAGIGFSPKTFMALMPLQVKERISGYVETFRSLPYADPFLVIDQFVRNNWDNDSLVPYKGDRALGHFEYDGVSLKIVGDNAIKRMKKVLYFKTSISEYNPETGNTEETIRLFRQIRPEHEEDPIVYTEVSPLGNNKNYLEIKTNYRDTAVERTKEIVEDTAPSELESSVPEEIIENEVTEPITLTERQNQEELLLKIYQVPGRTLEQAQDTINKFRSMQTNEREALKEQIKGFIRRRFQELGIDYDEQKIEDIYQLFC